MYNVQIIEHISHEDFIKDVEKKEKRKNVGKKNVGKKGCRV